MGEGVGEVLTFAVGVAISPVPIVAVILTLFSQGARTNGPAFMLGWISALSTVSAVVYLLADSANAVTSSSTSDAIAWVKLLLGAALLLLALRKWRNRPERGVDPPMPKWMAGVDSLAPGKAFGLGFALVGINPKNFVLTASAAAGLAELSLTTTETAVSLVTFVVIGSLTIAVPVVYYLLGGQRARDALDTMKTWLVAHNVAVMGVLFVVFGVDLIAEGITALAH